MNDMEGLDPNEPTFPPLIDTVSPRVLKAITDSPQFRRAYKSFKFGNILPGALSKHWWVWLIVVVVGMVTFLYFTGNLRV